MTPISAIASTILFILKKQKKEREGVKEKERNTKGRDKGMEVGRKEGKERKRKRGRKKEGGREEGKLASANSKPVSHNHLISICLK